MKFSLLKHLMLGLLVLVGVNSTLKAQSIQYGTKCLAYSQNFDSLAPFNSGVKFAINTTSTTATHLQRSSTQGPYGWYTSRSGGTGGTDSFQVSTGTANQPYVGSSNSSAATSGATYSYGTTLSASDRAIGVLASGSNVNRFGASLKNKTGVTLTSMTITFDGETYRKGDGASNNLKFEYKIGGTNIGDASGWTANTSLDYNSPVTSGAGNINVGVNGNNSSFRTGSISLTITGISWTANSILVIRWSDANDSGNDDGLGIDNFSFSASDGCCAPTTQASAITFSGTLNDQMQLNFTGGSGGNRIVVAKLGSTPTGTPSNNTTYSANSNFSSCAACTLSTGEKIVYNGSGTSVIVNGLAASSNYYYKIYEYSCSPGSEKYNTTSPASNNNTTLSSCPFPSTNATNIKYSQFTKTSTRLSWTNGSGIRRIVVLSLGGALANPVNNTTYSADSNYGSGTKISGSSYVVYDGNGSTVNIKGLTTKTLYNFGVFEYNCSPGSEKYTLISALKGAFVTAGTFTPGNIAVLRIGNGTFSSTGTEVFVDEIGKYSNAVTQSISLPTTGANKLIISQSATSEGNMSISQNGKILTMVGYDLTNPNGSGVTATAAAVNRSVGAVDISGSATIAAKINDGFSGNNPRSSTTIDGTGYWMAGGSSAATGGIRYVTSGVYNGTSTQVYGTTDAMRNVQIADGQLYGSSSSAFFKIGTGLPTTSGQTGTAVTATVATPGPFITLDATESIAGDELMYIVNQDANLTNAGIYKFYKTSASSAWVAAGKIAYNDSTNTVTNFPLVGITGKILQNGNVELFITNDLSSASNNSRIIKWVDVTAYNVSIGTTNTLVGVNNTNRKGKIIATSPIGSKFRGIQYSPVENVDATSNITLSGGTYNNITVRSGATVTLGGNITLYGTIRVKSGGKLDISSYTINGWGPGYRTLLVVEGNATLTTGHSTGLTFGNGASITVKEYYLSKNGATYEFTNSAGVTGSLLPDSVSNLVINTSGTVSLTKNLVVKNLLDVKSGTFKTDPYNGSQVTLTSNSTSTARIGKLTGGANVLGNVNHQRYIGGGSADTGWIFLSMPVRGSFVQWANDISMKGFPGVNSPNATAPNTSSVYKYDETVTGVINNGYTRPTSVSQILDSGRGYNIYFKTRPVTLTARGNIYSGTFNAPVTYTNTGSSTADGWNLIGNPYCSDIDWSTGVTTTNIDATIYIWKESSDVYATWNGTSGTNGGSKYIANSQGIFIHANASSPSVVFSENTKTSNLTAFIAKKAVGGEISMILTNNETSRKDNAIVQFNNDATSAFDNKIDGFKLNGSYENLSSVIEGSSRLAYNSLPLKEGKNIIPLHTEMTEGSHTLELSASDFVGSDLYLQDLELNTYSKVVGNLTYNFEVKDAKLSENRFQLVALNKTSMVDANGNINLENIVKVYPNPVQEKLNIETLSDIALNLTISDLTGRVVYSSNVSGAKINSINFDYPRGVYNVCVKSSTNTLNLKVVKQ